MSISFSIVIVNWNGRHLLEQCLADLTPTLDANDQVIIVDNGSHDGSVQWLASHYPHITCVALPHNLGFAGGNNAALPYCRHDWILLLNNDAFVEADAISHLRATITTAASDVGAVSATLVFAHAPDLVASAGITMRQDGVAIDRDMALSVVDLSAHAYPVFGASGGAVALRRQLIDEIGLFADDFFTYLEDVDLALRAILAGWQCLHCPQAIIRHVYSATSGQGSPLKQYYLGRNRWRTLIRCLPTRIWRTHWHRIIGYDLAACGVLALRGHWHGIWGRLQIIRTWSELRAQRHHIQRTRVANADTTLAAWLAPAPWPWQEYREIRRLQQILQHRSTKESS